MDGKPAKDLTLEELAFELDIIGHGFEHEIDLATEDPDESDKEELEETARQRDICYRAAKIVRERLGQAGGGEEVPEGVPAGPYKAMSDGTRWRVYAPDGYALAAIQAYPDATVSQGAIADFFASAPALAARVRRLELEIEEGMGNCERLDAENQLLKARARELEAITMRNIPSARRFWSGKAHCTACQHDWVAVVELIGDEADPIVPFECPNCEGMTGGPK